MFENMLDHPNIQSLNATIAKSETRRVRQAALFTVPVTITSTNAMAAPTLAPLDFGRSTRLRAGPWSTTRTSPLHPRNEFSASPAEHPTRPLSSSRRRGGPYTRPRPETLSSTRSTRRCEPRRRLFVGRCHLQVTPHDRWRGRLCRSTPADGPTRLVYRATLPRRGSCCGVPISAEVGRDASRRARPPCKVEGDRFGPLGFDRFGGRLVPRGETSA